MKKKYFTDKTFLIELLEENEENVKIKIVDCKSRYENAKKKVGQVLDYDRTAFYKVTVPYDLDNPLTVKLNAGKCYCETCGEEIYLGEDAFKYDGMVFCSKKCLDEYLDYELSEITEDDLDDSKTTEVPMFDYKGEDYERKN